MNRISLILRQRLAGIIFVIVALAGGIFIFWYISGLKEKIPENASYNHVFIAETDIRKEEEIKDGLIKMKKIPSDIFSGKFVMDKDRIIGKRVTADILKGEIITEDKLEEGEYTDGISLGFSSYIPDGLRAVSIPVNFYGDRSLINEGDRIDLISTYYVQEDGNLYSETIIAGKEIILIGSGHEEDYESSGSDGKNFIFGQADGGGLTDTYYREHPVITFYLTKTEAEEVFKAAERGVLNLSICAGN
ncbi:MAG: RcpC/CpaB family pilus assembly protein [Actinomycetota bacterium]|nr:RcpC/CpaB family pilus assembly protein [Actinomycetota bacterium]